MQAGRVPLQVIRLQRMHKRHTPQRSMPANLTLQLPTPAHHAVRLRMAAVHLMAAATINNI
jgi:hypothetical protein